MDSKTCARGREVGKRREGEGREIEMEEGGGGEGEGHGEPTVTQDQVKAVHTISCQLTQSLVGPFPWDPRRQFMAEQCKWQIII